MMHGHAAGGECWMQISVNLECKKTRTLPKYLAKYIHYLSMSLVVSTLLAFLSGLSYKPRKATFMCLNLNLDAKAP